MPRKFGRMKEGQPRANPSMAPSAVFVMKRAAGIVGLVRAWSLGRIPFGQMKAGVEDAILDIECGLLQIEAERPEK